MELTLATASAAVWWRLGAPALLTGRPDLRVLANATRSNPAVAVMAAAGAGALGVQLFLAVAVAPNNWDAMTYHLSRAAYWLQNKSALHWHGGSVLQLGHPPNAEMLQAWTMSLAGSDRLAQVVQWLAMIGIALVIGQIACLLGFAPASAVFAGALFVTLPQPLLQAAGAQNDLVVTFFLIATLLFGARGLAGRRRGDLAIGCVALGLAVGTKGTLFFALPSLAFVFAYAALRNPPSRSLLAWAAAMGVAAVAIWGSFNYILNLADGNGLAGGADTYVRNNSVSAGVVENIARISWTSFVDAQQLAPQGVQRLVRGPGNRLFRSLDANRSCCPGLHPYNNYVYPQLRHSAAPPRCSCPSPTSATFPRRSNSSRGEQGSAATASSAGTKLLGGLCRRPPSTGPRRRLDLVAPERTDRHERA